MALSERDRHDAYDAMHGAFGERTDTVIRMLRDDDRDLATTQDLAVTRSELRSDFGELRGEFGELRGEFGELRGEFGEVRADMARLEGRLEARITDSFQAQTRALILALVASVFLIALTSTLTVLMAR